MDGKVQCHGENPAGRFLHPGNYHLGPLCTRHSPNASLDIPQLNKKSDDTTHIHQLLLYRDRHCIDLLGIHQQIRWGSIYQTYDIRNQAQTRVHRLKPNDGLDQRRPHRREQAPRWPQPRVPGRQPTLPPRHRPQLLAHRRQR